VDEGVFLGYSLNNHAYTVYNKRLVTMEEFVRVVFNETNHATKVSSKYDVGEDEHVGTFLKFRFNSENGSLENTI